MSNSPRETQNKTTSRFQLSLDPTLHAASLPSDLMNLQTPLSTTDVSTKTPWSYPSSLSGSFSESYPSYPYAGNYYADPANLWEYNPMHGIPAGHDSAVGINIPPSKELLKYPLIISGEDEAEANHNAAPSYAQVTRINADTPRHTNAAEIKHSEGVPDNTEGATEDNTHAQQSNMVHAYSYVPYYPGNSGYMETYPYAPYPEQKNRPKFAPRDHDDLSAEFRKLTNANLPTIFAGSRYKDIHCESHCTEDSPVNGVPHTRQEFTFVALASMYGARHFHDMDPMELGEFNHSLALVLDAIPSASTIIVPFGFLRKEHPSPYCLVQCADFASESERLGMKVRPYVKLEYEEETEAKDITACMQSICKGQLNFLKHTSLLQAMKDRIDLTLLFFLIYDCFRSDFVNFEVEFRSIREGPVQIVIRTSKRYICKRKNTVQVDPSIPGIDCRVVHSTEHWKKLPDAPLSIIETPLEGCSALPPPIHPPVPTTANTTKVSFVSRVFACIKSAHSATTQFRFLPDCRILPSYTKSAYEAHKSVIPSCPCPMRIVPRCVQNACDCLKARMKNALHNSGLPCPRHFFSERANVVRAVAVVSAALSMGSVAFLGAQAKAE